MAIDIVQPNLTDKPAANVDHPRVRMIDESLDPSRSTLSSQRTHITPAHSKHLDYIRVIAQGEASFHIIVGGSPEPKFFPFQVCRHSLSQWVRKVSKHAVDQCQIFGTAIRPVTCLPASGARASLRRRSAT